LEKQRVTGACADRAIATGLEDEMTLEIAMIEARERATSGTRQRNVNGVLLFRDRASIEPRSTRISI
jgi:hypothetical protein